VIIKVNTWDVYKWTFSSVNPVMKFKRICFPDKSIVNFKGYGTFIITGLKESCKGYMKINFLVR
jgi:hypothetical protein